MRRAIPVLAATGGALALLASFHTDPAGSTAAIAAGASPTTTVAPDPTRGTTNPSSGITSTTASGGTRAIDGPVASNDYGDVQVRVTVKGNQIVDVQPLQLPHDRSRSARISQAAGPILRTEALRAQSANIDLVSGATFTSESYAESLQGALDKAKR